MGRTDSDFKNTQIDSKFKMGLSEKEVRKKYEIHGPNVLSDKKKISAIKILLEQFSDFMVMILIAATVVSAFMGEITEAITIIAIVIINAILGFVQAFRTEKTMEALKNLAAPNAKVIREGRLHVIPAHEIVPGDIIVFEAGDRIPADAVLIEINNLQVDESLLTGESFPVEKETYNKNKAGEDKKNHVFMGTIVTNGKGTAVVNATGMLTEMGKIAQLIQEIDEDDTPLQKRLDHLGKFIVFGCLIICAIVTITGILRGEALITMFLAGISLAVAAVPEGLPAIVTIALALGVQRMLKRNALIRKLPAVETLGCASVICSDKTGTLTENKMTVRKLYSGEAILEIKGGKEDKRRDFYLNEKETDPLRINSVRLALEIGAICNNAVVEEKVKGDIKPLSKIKTLIFSPEKSEIIGDPTEAALLTAAIKAGMTKDTLDRTYFRIDEIPFDSERKLMSVICDNHKGETFIFTKGAPDILIEKCSKLYTSAGIKEMTSVLKRGIMNINDKMAGEALRVIGVAYRHLDSRIYKQNEIEKDLVFAGLFGMIDPPRMEVLEAVNKCKMAGIKPVMITGDHRITAAAIARELNILNTGDRVLTGTEIEGLSENGLEKAVNNVSVYARVSPKHKLMIVKALKKSGKIVAMTGDGVNDAPAIKEANIGISMGKTGTDVTKEASSMILLDDNFATIVAAIEEGRVIYNNIRKFIRYMLACNFGEVLTMFLGMLAGLPLPLLPIQILWVNLATDGLPAIALGLDPPDKDVMFRSPRKENENIFSNGLLKLIIFRGFLIGLCTLAVFTSLLYFAKSIDTARTGAFCTLVIAQLIHVFECKSERKTILEIPIFNNIYLVLAVICSLIMVLGVIYIPFFQNIFNTVPMKLNDWMIILGFSTIGPAFSNFFKINKK